MAAVAAMMAVAVYFFSIFRDVVSRVASLAVLTGSDAVREKPAALTSLLAASSSSSSILVGGAAFCVQ